MYRKPYFLAALILLMPLSRMGSALSEEILALADDLMEEGNYNEAITEYKRFAFFNPENERVGYALFRMGLAHRAERNWQAAIDAFSGSISATEKPEIADERRIILATTLIASGNYSLARLKLLDVTELSKNPSLHIRSLYFDGVASLYMFDWDSAGETFRRFYSEHPGGRMTERAGQVDAILIRARKSYKSEGLAGFFSTIIPGLGQIYAGNWRSGLNALLLNSVTIGFLANRIHKEDYKNAALVSSIALRYYMGNIYNARMDIRKYNESQDRQNASKILNIVRVDEPQ